MTKKFAMIAAVSISALLILFSACSKEITAVKLKGLISSGEYSKAVNYYLKNTSKISESEAEELFKDGLNDILEDYMDEDADTDTVTEFVVALENLGSAELSSYGKMIYKAAGNVDAAKARFDEAEKEYKAQHFPPAIPMYTLIAPVRKQLRNYLNITMMNIMQMPLIMNMFSQAIRSAICRLTTLSFL